MSLQPSRDNEGKHVEVHAATAVSPSNTIFISDPGAKQRRLTTMSAFVAQQSYDAAMEVLAGHESLLLK
ncbi:MAG: hypothetical protein GY811_19210 [Myxococcales bacterium]|nr:hypothetical protein [Myxococcales bacterium]